MLIAPQLDRALGVAGLGNAARWVYTGAVGRSLPQKYQVRNTRTGETRLVLAGEGRRLTGSMPTGSGSTSTPSGGTTAANTGDQDVPTTGGGFDSGGNTTPQTRRERRRARRENQAAQQTQRREERQAREAAQREARRAARESGSGGGSGSGSGGGSGAGMTSAGDLVLTHRGREYVVPGALVPYWPSDRFAAILRTGMVFPTAFKLAMDQAKRDRNKARRRGDAPPAPAPGGELPDLDLGPIGDDWIDFGPGSGSGGTLIDDGYAIDYGAFDDGAESFGFDDDFSFDDGGDVIESVGDDGDAFADLIAEDDGDDLDFDLDNDDLFDDEDEYEDDDFFEDEDDDEGYVDDDESDDDADFEDFALGSWLSEAIKGKGPLKDVVGAGRGLLRTVPIVGGAADALIDAAGNRGKKRGKNKGQTLPNAVTAPATPPASTQAATAVNQWVVPAAILGGALVLSSLGGRRA